jgi:hypothetical protein
MELRGNGTRYINYDKWEKKENMPYDYAKNGLLSRIMSPVILNTTNNLLKLVLNYVESSLVFVMKYTDILKNFKNVHWRNR